MTHRFAKALPARACVASVYSFLRHITYGHHGVYCCKGIRRWDGSWQALAQLGIKLSAAEVQGCVQAFDGNGDGQIDYSELSLAVSV